MDLLSWVFTIAIVVAVLAVLFAVLVRSRRSGSVLAARKDRS